MHQSNIINIYKDHYFVSYWKKEITYCPVLCFPATNNEAEYEALITCLLIPRGVGIKVIDIHCDSQLVVKHVLGECEAHVDKMKAYAARVMILMKDVMVEIKEVP